MLDIITYEIVCIIENIFPLKKQGKRYRNKHFLKEANKKIAYKETVEGLYAYQKTRQG